ncbi:MAG: cupin domain-containing protein [Blastocatellia bacterium]
MKRTWMMAGMLLAGVLIGAGIDARKMLSAFARPAEQTTKGYILEHDAEVAKPGPAPHNGPGRSTGYNFFEQARDFNIIFRKRVLHPGAAIGYHLQKEYEVYYILGGSGVMQMNGQEFPVKPGDGILTYPGSSHGLKQTGKDDLVLMISYEKHP